MQKIKGISTFVVEDIQKGFFLANDFLNKNLDSKSLLFLSGGSTPKYLYELLTKEKKISVGAAAMVDERFGKKMHENSNEKMIKDTGILSYFKEKKVPFYSILQTNLVGRQEHNLVGVASNYDKKIKSLLKNFSKSIAIMGIGEDGHTAGINNSKLIINNYVTSINNFPGKFRERITLTFNALSKIDHLIILAFGNNKKNALELMFKKGSIKEIPARFYVKPEIAAKTLLITDQKI